LQAAGSELAELALRLVGRAGARPVAVVGRLPSLHPAIGAAIADRLVGIPVSYPEADAALHAARLAATIHGTDHDQH
ncbi:hypothetical protein J8J40_33990, partial [Mycobacterium tuberculosis]|nr:hypothetical protein [Mycobacterium tuberculosis]